MTEHNENLKALKSYFESTPQDVLDKDYLELKPVGEVGPDCLEVLNHWRTLGYLSSPDILGQLREIEPANIVIVSIPYHRLIGMFKGVEGDVCILHKAVSGLVRRIRTVWMRRPVKISLIRDIQVLEPSSRKYQDYLKVLDSIYSKQEATEVNA